MMWVEMIRGAYIVNNTQKTVGNLKNSLDTKAPNENSHETRGPGSPYLTQPIRTLAQAVEDLGLDRHGDLLCKGEPPVVDRAASAPGPAVVVQLTSPQIVGRTTKAVSPHLPTADTGVDGLNRKVANAK